MVDAPGPGSGGVLKEEDRGRQEAQPATPSSVSHQMREERREGFYRFPRCHPGFYIAHWGWPVQTAVRDPSKTGLNLIL